MAQRFKREILPATEDRPQIELVRSARRTRTISMQRNGVDEHGDPAYRLLIPAASTSEEIDEHIARLLPRIQRRAARRERATQLTVTDEYLRSRALHLAQKNLPELVASGRLEKLSIRWVSNQPPAAAESFGGVPCPGGALPAAAAGAGLPGGVRAGALAC